MLSRGSTHQIAGLHQHWCSSAHRSMFSRCMEVTYVSSTHQTSHQMLCGVPPRLGDEGLSLGAQLVRDEVEDQSTHTCEGSQLLLCPGGEAMMAHCPRTQDLYRDGTNSDHMIYHTHHPPDVLGSCLLTPLSPNHIN